MDFFSKEQEQANQREYENMLVKRYQTGQILTKSDKQKAKKLIKQRAIEVANVMKNAEI